MQELRANTAVKVVVGPFVAVGDGFTPQTSVVLAATADEAQLIKHENATDVDVSSNTWAAIDATNARGYYHMTLTASNLDTPGTLTLVIADDSIFLPIRQDFMVLDEGHYDAKYLPSRIAGATTGTPTTTTCNSDLTGYANDELIGRTIIFVSGTAAGQASDITDYVSTSGVLTYTGIATAPAASDKFIIV